MSFSEMLGRQFDWHGEDTRLQYLKVWICWIALITLYFLPIYGLFLNFLADSIDYGIFAALFMMMDNTLNPFISIALIIWHWTGCCVLTGMFVMVLMATARRLAHMGWSRWCVTLAAIPVVDILFLLILFLWPGRMHNAQIIAQEPMFKLEPKFKQEPTFNP